MLSLKSAEKKKVISVLRYCSNQHKYYKQAEGIMGRKYLQRFKYKHRRRYHNIFTINSVGKCRKLNRDYIIGITTLYALYKASKASSKFSACRKFKRGGINL
jgi:ATP-dependent helicase/DNAse subunit B